MAKAMTINASPLQGTAFYRLLIHKAAFLYYVLLPSSGRIHSFNEIPFFI